MGHRVTLEDSILRVILLTQTLCGIRCRLHLKLYYEANVDNETYEVSFIELDEQKKQHWTLKNVKHKLIDENEWGDSATVAFFRCHGNKRLALTTTVQELVDENSAENALKVIAQSKSFMASSNGTYVEGFLFFNLLLRQRRV